MDLATAHPYHVIASIFFVSTIIILKTARINRNPKRLPLPPGPKGYPIIGNLFDTPTVKPWLVYNEWAKIYGDILYFEVLGQPFLVLNSLERARDLFEKRSAIYSDRMRMPMIVDLMGWDYSMGLMPYGSWWRRHQRAFHENFHADAVAKHRQELSRQAAAFLSRLLHSPQDFIRHIRHTIGAEIMSVTYGIDIKESEDPYIANAEAALAGFSEAATPGRFWVDQMPFLKHIPSWLPGAGFKRQAAKWKKLNEKIKEQPFQYVKDQMANGSAGPSVAARLIDKLPDEKDPARAEAELIAKNTAAAAYAGGIDSTAAVIEFFFLAMATHPGIQKKAQAEIDAVVGPNRLPDFGDRTSLPYINAILKETMRWQVVAPLAVPHSSSSEDEYNGYFIPEGTVVFCNAWTILHDPKLFPNPFEFQPERYLTKEGKLDPNANDPDCAIFGFGRRICPGRFLSDNSLYAIISSILAVFNITPPIDKEGKTIHLKPEVTTGLPSRPEAFKVIIKPRTTAAAGLIRDSAEVDL